MTQVIKDLEEALTREVATLTTNYQTTKTNSAVQTTFNPFTGEEICIAISANFYDESSGANSVTYPRADVKFDTISEDRSSGRMVSLWEDYQSNYRTLIEPNRDRPQVYQQVVSERNGVNIGTGLQIGPIEFAKVNQSDLVKIMSGNNEGTYKILSLDIPNTTLILDPSLVSDIQEISFNSNTRKLYLLNNMDLFNVRTGDVFTDALGGTFKIVDINTKKREILLGGNLVPDLGLNSSITRSGDILRNSDSNPVWYVVMDSTKPLYSKQFPEVPLTDKYLTSLHMTPFNYHWTIEIKNNERTSHIAIADRVTETIVNRPRRHIKVLLRCEESAESDVTCGPDIGIGQEVLIKDATHFCVNDSVHFINKFSISENNQIIDIDYETNKITLRNKVPIEYSEKIGAVLVANALAKSWSFFLQDGTGTMGQDAQNNFFRQEYAIRIEGWKSEKTKQRDEGAITQVTGTIVTENTASEDFNT